MNSLIACGYDQRLRSLKTLFLVSAFQFQG